MTSRPAPTDNNDDADGTVIVNHERMNRAYVAAVPHEIEGLYPSFQTAVTILRIARSLGELQPVDAENSISSSKQDLDTFFQRLVVIERQLMALETKPLLQAINHRAPFVVVVEGLDGCGKTSLVTNLAKALLHTNGRTATVATGTPTASMNSVRDIFDRRGGAVARAFYMVSNYVLQHEILLLAEEHKQKSASEASVVVVVDRWYASTVAYSIGWKNTSGGPESVDTLDDSLFQWPRDMMQPDLMLLLQVDAHNRKERVRSRAIMAAADINNHNPWDKRLQDDEHLGQRIMRGLERVSFRRQQQQQMQVVDANQSQEKVLQDALSIVQDRFRRHVAPWEYYRHQPLEFFCWTCSQLGLCDFKTGRRLKHAPWAIQLALNSSVSGAPPSLRTVGIHTADESGIVFFSRGHPGGGSGGDTNALASVIWLGGEYPHEQQWRAEGILFDMAPSECTFTKIEPPASLVAQIAACAHEEKQVTATTSGTDEGVERRFDIPKTHAELAKHLRLKPEHGSRIVCGTRFVPLRMEALIGGPSSPPDGPLRIEWTKSLLQDKSEEKHNSNNGWSQVRAILPFSPPSSIHGPVIARRPPFLPVTLALTGTHCSGKATLGKKIADVMGWSFHEELGDVLRNREDIVAGGHRIGDGSGSQNAMSWDDRIFAEEAKRDHQQQLLNARSSSRAVETWHVGNLAWALFRKERSPQEPSSDDDLLPRPLLDRQAEKLLVDKTKHAILEHTQVASVLLVHLSTSTPDVSIRRRQIRTNAERIPMKHELQECADLHDALGIRSVQLLQQFQEELNLPVLIVDNSSDGEAAMDATARRIVQFINENLWRRGL